jgi:hypothetical protein
MIILRVISIRCTMVVDPIPQTSHPAVSAIHQISPHTTTTDRRHHRSFLLPIFTIMVPGAPGGSMITSIIDMMNVTTLISGAEGEGITGQVAETGEWKNNIARTTTARAGDMGDDEKAVHRRPLENVIVVEAQTRTTMSIVDTDPRVEVETILLLAAAVEVVQVVDGGDVAPREVAVDVGTPRTHEVIREDEGEGAAVTTATVESEIAGAIARRDRAPGSQTGDPGPRNGQVVGEPAVAITNTPKRRLELRHQQKQRNESNQMTRLLRSSRRPPNIVHRAKAVEIKIAKRKIVVVMTVTAAVSTTTDHLEITAGMTGREVMNAVRIGNINHEKIDARNQRQRTTTTK